MRRLLAIVLCLLATVAIARDGIQDPGGDIPRRVRQLYRAAQAKAFDITTTKADSANRAAESEAGDVWITTVSGANYLCASFGDSTFCVRGSDLDWIIGNEILNVTDASVTRSGSGTTASPYTVGLNLANANTWTATQTFDQATATTFRVASAGGGYTDIKQQTTGSTLLFALPSGDGDNGNFLKTNGSGTLSWGTEADPVVVGRQNTWTAVQTFDSTIVANDGVDLPIGTYDNSGVPNPPRDSDCNTAYPAAVVGHTAYMKDDNDGHIYLVMKKGTNDWWYEEMTGCP